MMRINLLPREYRDPAGPPPGRIAVIAVSLVVLGFAVSAWLLLVLVQAPSAREERRAVLEKLSSHKQEQKQIAAQRAALEVLRAERAAFHAMLDGREPWSRRLEQLSRAVSGQPAWLEGLRLRREARDDDAAWSDWALSLDAMTARADESQVSALRKALLAASGGTTKGEYLRSRTTALAPRVQAYAANGKRYRETEHYAVDLLQIVRPRVARPAASERGSD